MAYEFESFCEDCRNAYNGTTGEANLEVIRLNLEKLIRENPKFKRSFNTEFALAVDNSQFDSHLDLSSGGRGILSVCPSVLISMLRFLLLFSIA
mgnify:CR=1 FL=1